MSRFKNCQWDFPINPSSPNNPLAWEHVQIAVLMDIRDELQTLNRLLGCPDFIEIPRVLRTIQQNTRKPVRKPRARKVATK